MADQEKRNGWASYTAAGASTNVSLFDAESGVTIWPKALTFSSTIAGVLTITDSDGTDTLGIYHITAKTTITDSWKRAFLGAGLGIKFSFDGAGAHFISMEVEKDLGTI